MPLVVTGCAVISTTSPPRLPQAGSHAFFVSSTVPSRPRPLAQSGTRRTSPNFLNGGHGYQIRRLRACRRVPAPRRSLQRLPTSSPPPDGRKGPISAARPCERCSRFNLTHPI